MDTDRIIAMLGEHGAKADRRRNYGDGVPSHTAMLMGEAIALIRKLSGSHGEPCQHCDDTGDVHGVDGEWRGVCSCPAGKRMVSNNFLRIAIETYDDVFDGFPESREAAMRAALEAVYAVQDCPAQTRPAPAGGDAGGGDTKRLNWLALNPRGAKIVVDGETKDCIFWGVSSVPEHTLREAIDAAMTLTAKPGAEG